MYFTAELVQFGILIAYDKSTIFIDFKVKGLGHIRETKAFYWSISRYRPFTFGESGYERVAMSVYCHVDHQIQNYSIQMK